MLKHIIKVTLVTLVIAGLILPFLQLRAAEPEKASSGKDAGRILDELAALKENSVLSPSERTRQEITIRKEALSKIIELSNEELDALASKLAALDFPEKTQWAAIRERLTALIGTYADYQRATGSALASESDLAGIKDLSRAYKAWREDYYIPATRMMLNFILIAQEKAVLQTADSRLEKIISDLKKLESAQLISNGDFQSSLDLSVTHLADAGLYNKEAERLFFAALAANDFFATASVAGIRDTASSASSTAAKIQAGERIASLIEKSLTEIKSTYLGFLDISKLVKKKLGF